MGRRGYGFGFGRRRAAGGLDAAAAAYFAAMAVPPDGARRTLVNNMIVSLKAAGVWAKLDWLSLVAAHDAQAARINALNPAQVMTEVNAPAFVADRGYTGDGAASYLNTGWNPASASSPKFTQNSAHHGAWIGTEVASTSQSDYGGANNPTNTKYDGTRYRGGVNSTSTIYTPGGAVTSLGHWCFSRPDAAGFQPYKNGAALGASVTAASAAPANGAFFVLAYNNNNANGTTPLQYSTRRVQALHWGSHLSGAEVGALYAALAAYMAAVGA